MSRFGVVRFDAWDLSYAHQGDFTCQCYSIGIFHDLEFRDYPNYRLFSVHIMYT